MGPSWETFVQIFGALLLVVLILFCLGCYLCWRFDKATYRVSRYQSQYQRRHRQRQNSVTSQAQSQTQSQTSHGRQSTRSSNRHSTVINPNNTTATTASPSNNIQMTLRSGSPNPSVIPHVERRTTDQLNETEIHTAETNPAVDFQRQASHSSLQSVRRNRSQSGSRSLPSQSRRSSVSPRRGERGRVSVSPYHLSPATCSNSNPNSNTSSNFNLSSNFFIESNEGCEIGMDSDFNSSASRHSSDILLNVHINDNDDLPDYETVSEADEKSASEQSPDPPSYAECISNTNPPMETFNTVQPSGDVGLSSSHVSTTISSSTTTVVTISLPTISLQAESTEDVNNARLP